MTKPHTQTERVSDVIVAAYNEGDRIGDTVTALREIFPQARILVADDGSTDNTAQAAAEAGAEVARSEQNIGKGGAASLAAARVVGSTHHAAVTTRGPRDVVLLCDADLGLSAARLAPLVETVASGEAELAVAVFARKLGGGFGVARDFARWAIRYRCGLQTTAPISGQRVLTHEALAAVTPFHKGFGMEIGMTVDAVRAGCRVVEVEVDLEHRHTGKTLRGFIHRGRQLRDFVGVFLATRPGKRTRAA